MIIPVPKFRLMRRLAMVVACFVVLFLVNRTALAATVVRVGVYSNPPAVELPPRGIYVQLLEYAAKQDGFELRYVPGTFKEGLDRLARGDIDVMVDVARTPQRERLFDFTWEPVLHSWNEVYARRGLDIRKMEDLQYRRVSVLAGSVQEQFLQEAASSFGVSTQVVPFPSYEAAFAAVRSGDTDAVVANPRYGETHSEGLKDTGISFGSNTLHFVARKGTQQAVLASLDAHLARLKADPNSFYFREYQRLLVTQRPVRLPPWAVPTAAGATLLVALALGWALSACRAAARLRRSEARQRELAHELQRVFDSSLDVICVMDANLRLHRISPAVRQFGHDPADLVGEPVLTLVAPECRAHAEAVLRSAAGDAPVTAQPGRLLQKDGPAVEISFSAVASQDQREIFCVIRDETERTQLLRSIEQRTADVERANEDLQIVSYSLSHDLRAPLAAVHGFVSAALDAPEQEVASRPRHLLQRASASATRMSSMVEELAELLRVAGQELHPRSCDLSAMAGNVAASLQDRSSRESEVSIQPDLRVHADPRLLRVALENLLANAWKFSARSDSPRIEVGQLPATGNENVFFVRDNGAGFDMEYAQRLFRPFSRLHTQSEFAGSGMGLSIVHRIITRHSGRIWADGAPGRGATFYFSLPARCPEASDVATSKSVG